MSVSRNVEKGIPMNKHIGEKIKKLRKEKKLTLADIAQDQMSPAMISLIENGKSKPSAENLQHIAQQLGVSVSELLGGKTNEELRKEISYINHLLEDNYEEETLTKAINHIKKLLPELGNNFESARIYEIYSRCLFSFYQYHKVKYDALEDQDWTKYALRAEKLYNELQMENRVLKIRFFFANVEFSQANYKKTLELINESLERVTENDYGTISVIIDLMLLKFDALEALGYFEESLQVLDEVIRFSNKHVMLHRFFEIHNRGALSHFNKNDFKMARIYMEKMNQFFQLIDNDYLYIEKELIFIHYMEFFENQPEKSLEMIDEFEKKTAQMEFFKGVWRSTYEELLSDMKARCLTKLKHPNQALPLFRKLIKEDELHIEYSPMDAAIRKINGTYQALCYMDLNEYDQALTYAQDAVNQLRFYPHTTYYQFARNVLQDIQIKSKDYTY